MKATCIHCHRFTFDSNSITSKILIAKLRALKFGLSEILESIGGEIRERIENGSAIGLYLFSIRAFIIFAFSNYFSGEKIDLLGENSFLLEIDQIIAKLANIDSVDTLRSRHFSTQNLLRNDLFETEILIKTFLKELVIFKLFFSVFNFLVKKKNSLSSV